MRLARNYLGLRFVSSPAVGGPVIEVPEIVGVAKSTSSGGGQTIVIPNPPQPIEDGDQLYVVTACAAPVAPPTGWELLASADSPFLQPGIRVWGKIADSEPSSRSWAVENPIQPDQGTERSGCLVVVRGGDRGQIAVDAGFDGSPFTAPAVTSGARRQGLWLGFFAGTEAPGSAAENVTAAGDPHTLLVQHSGLNFAGTISKETAISTFGPFDSQFETVSGRQFADADPDLDSAGYVVALIVNSVRR